MNKVTSRTSHQNALIGAIVLAILANLSPWLQLVLRPLTYLNTHIHELCHALVTVATGGQVQDILVNADGSGTTPVFGGNIFLIACAGYLGATLLGAGIILVGSTVQRAKITMGVLAALLAFSLIVWVRGDFVGIVSGFSWVFVLAIGAYFLRGTAALFACQFLGAMQCLNSVTSVYELLQISVAGDVHSDAEIMQAHTLIPAALWAGLWCLISLATLAFTVRLVWSSERPKSSPAG